jgi:hypothetical protein
MFVTTMTDNDLSKNWPVPSVLTYIEVADRLLVMAAQAKSLGAQLQFEQLARLYEKLAATVMQSSEITAAVQRLATDVAPGALPGQHH